MKYRRIFELCILSMVLCVGAALLVVPVRAVGPSIFLACSKSTCEPLESGPDSKMLISDSIHMVQNSDDCPGVCSNIGTGAGVTYHVIGAARDVICQIFGAASCVWDMESLEAKVYRDATYKRHERNKQERTK